MSTLVTNTITGLSTAANITIGSTPVVSASATSLTIRGEGSAQTSVQQGLAKSWINFNGTGTIAARDSFNHSSLTDVSGGNYTVTMASAMGNVNYSFTGGVAESLADNASRVVNFGSNYDANTLDPNFTTTAYSVNNFFPNSNGTTFDSTFISNQIFGDLA